jgi:OmpA-OmpF porin, OOP family
MKFMHRVVYVAGAVLMGMASLIPPVTAQSVKLEGFITSRNGDSMTVKTSESPNVSIVLTDETEVGQVQGLLKARRKEMSMAALIPGLAVKVEAEPNAHNQLVARKISFKGDDLEQAEAMEAGMHETKAQTQQNAEKLEKQQAQMSEQQAKIAENKAAIDATIARFGQLDDYYIFNETTVDFENGQTNVDPKYISPLLELADSAKPINGYVIEVKGYASAVGSAALNQQLSEDRADEVTNILTQQGHIPLTRMLAPGAMGETHQIGNDKTPEGEAQNRRVVVRVLQNKGIAGV